MSTTSKPLSPAEAYRIRLEAGEPVDLLSFIQEFPQLEPDELSEICRHDLRFRWQLGENRPSEWYFEAIPKLAENADQVIDLAYCEYLVQESLGVEVDESAFLARFPQVMETLRSQIQLHRLVDGATKVLDTKQSSTTNSEARISFFEDSPSMQLPERLGRYQLTRVLGKGGMGLVFLARDQVLNREVAIKIPNCKSSEQPDIIKRLYLEARAAAKLQHPGVCQVYDVGEIGGKHFISMEYIKGQTLAQYLSSNMELDIDHAVSIALKIAEAIAFAHEQGVLHRDLKPSNVMIDEKLNIRVMDFGLARLSLANESTITRTGDILGTPSYSSPEQLRGEMDRLGPTTDVYGLGSLLYFLLIGRPPFVGNIATVIQQVLESTPDPPSKRRPGIPAYLDQICLKALAKNPSDRFSTAAEFVQVLSDQSGLFSRGFPETSSKKLVGSARPQKNPAPTRKQWRVLFAFLFATCLLASVIAFLAYAPWRKRQISTAESSPALSVGSTWVGEFRFDESEALPVELVISNTSGNTLEALYRTENKFEWELAGTLNGNSIEWKFMYSNHPDGEMLVQTGKLSSVFIDESTMDVQFYDSSDQSATRFRLTKVGREPAPR